MCQVLNEVVAHSIAHSARGVARKGSGRSRRLSDGRAGCFVAWWHASGQQGRDRATQSRRHHRWWRTAPRPSLWTDFPRAGIRSPPTVTPSMLHAAAPAAPAARRPRPRALPPRAIRHRARARRPSSDESFENASATSAAPSASWTRLRGVLQNSFMAWSPCGLWGAGVAPAAGCPVAAPGFASTKRHLVGATIYTADDGCLYRS